MDAVGSALHILDNVLHIPHFFSRIRKALLEALAKANVLHPCGNSFLFALDLFIKTGR